MLTELLIIFYILYIIYCTEWILLSFNETTQNVITLSYVAFDIDLSACMIEHFLLNMKLQFQTKNINHNSMDVGSYAWWCMVPLLCMFPHED